MTPADFEAAFQELLAEHRGRSQTNQGSIECVDCEQCFECTFCRSSSGLVRCHYCHECTRCFNCTHCRDSSELLGCNHCVGSVRCTQSSYLALCVDCTDSSYCFGCVGLSKRDFHILNEPYERRDYFELTLRLSPSVRRLGAR